jgi:cobalt-zinc-cadmium efflux system membrane fusion protein
VNKKVVIIGVILTIALGGGLIYRFTHLKSGGGEQAEHAGEAGHKEEKSGHDEGKEEKAGVHDEHEGEGRVKMALETQKKNGVTPLPRLSGDN